MIFTFHQFLCFSSVHRPKIEAANGDPPAESGEVVNDLIYDVSGLDV